MLAAFRPPPGAVRTGPLKVALLAQVGQLPEPRLVTRTQWYRVPGQPLAALGWITLHCPAGMTLSYASGVGWNPERCGSLHQRRTPPVTPPPGMHFVQVWNDMFSGAAGNLVATVAGDGPGIVGLRVDAQVMWVPPKPAAEHIPSAAKVVTIAYVPGYGPQPAGFAPVTITDPAKVARIAAVVDGLPVYPPGTPLFCNMDYNGSGMRLTFRATLSGPALATAQTGNCDTVAVTVGGKPMPLLDQAQSLQQQVTAIAGLHWPAAQPPAPTAPGPTAPGPTASA
jgi:hypothetical protein